MSKMKIILIMLLTLSLWTLDARAVVVKKLRLESVPSGAEAYLLQGMKEVYLGNTPMEYQAEFHSEISILRMAFKKPGYDTKTIEVSAKQDRVEVNLVPRSLTADPGTFNDATLRDVQNRVNSTIKQTLPKLLAARGPYEFELAGPLRVTRLDDKILLILPIELGKAKDKVDRPAQDQNEIFLKTIWDQFGQGMVIPLVKEVRNEPLLSGILLDVDYSRVGHGFVGVRTRVESRIEMKCVPGTEARQVYNPCLRRKTETYYSMGQRMTRDAGCEGGYQTQMVYNPCITKVPVTRTEVKIDPKATSVTIQSRAQYVFPIELIEIAGEQDKVFSQLGILMTNERGETVTKRGLIPSSLPRIPKHQ